ncbi:MAG: adenosylcobinamide-GDP ribazoletransferase [Methanobacteriaceae archaeon]|nr:adenosylcobinamide-GDP ribazoletransferase [Methanobacteriaceae archaeon]
MILDGLRGLLGLLSFSIILPLNIHTSIKEMAKVTWLWPLLGGFIGIIVGTSGFVVLNIFSIDQLITAAIVYSFSILLTGFHHLDGLIDMGDALMAHGNFNRKIDIMRDSRIGTGGIATFFIIALITVTSINTISPDSIFFVLLISEIGAKMGLITCCTFSRPFKNGTGKFFIESMNKKLLLLSFILFSVLGFAILNFMGVLGIIGGALAGIILALISRKSFYWTTGDILGASNEIARMLSLLIMTSVVIPWTLMF